MQGFLDLRCDVLCDNEMINCNLFGGHESFTIWMLA
jgi:hypothetical protein